MVVVVVMMTVCADGVHLTFKGSLDTLLEDALWICLRPSRALRGHRRRVGHGRRLVRTLLPRSCTSFSPGCSYRVMTSGWRRVTVVMSSPSLSARGTYRMPKPSLVVMILMHELMLPGRRAREH